jgi:hypothetical protein
MVRNSLILLCLMSRPFVPQLCSVRCDVHLAAYTLESVNRVDQDCKLRSSSLYQYLKNCVLIGSLGRTLEVAQLETQEPSDQRHMEGSHCEWEWRCRYQLTRAKQIRAGVSAVRRYMIWIGRNEPKHARGDVSGH